MKSKTAVKGKVMMKGGKSAMPFKKAKPDLVKKLGKAMKKLSK